MLPGALDQATATTVRERARALRTIARQLFPGASKLVLQTIRLAGKGSTAKFMASFSGGSSGAAILLVGSPSELREKAKQYRVLSKELEMAGETTLLEQLLCVDHRQRTTAAAALPSSKAMAACETQRGDRTCTSLFHRHLVTPACD